MLADIVRYEEPRERERKRRGSRKRGKTKRKSSMFEMFFFFLILVSLMRLYDSIGYSLVEFRSSGYIFFFSQ